MLEQYKELLYAVVAKIEEDLFNGTEPEVLAQQLKSVGLPSKFVLMARIMGAKAIHRALQTIAQRDMTGYRSPLVGDKGFDFVKRVLDNL